ncbi:hypothetical protein [Phenylobacterium sp.]|uniref:hypothetical protein n=1 Tax=Phenylobacterium sp. TaxID=1871053 RepID=UPI0028128B48|nr:hypothetical protein [Phenylobacterium sp.]
MSLVDGLLAVGFGLLGLGAVMLWALLEMRRSPRAQAAGWTAVCAVAGLGAAVWKLRHGGGPGAVVLWGLGGAAAAWIVLAGAAARTRTARAMIDRSARPGSRLSKRRPMDFSGD